MERERWLKVEQLYHAALGMEASQRQAFIEEACAGDASLIEEVAALLSPSKTGDNFLEVPAAEVAAQAMAMSAAAASPTTTRRTEAAAMPVVPPAIGRYRVLRLVGEGGMGVVYQAEQEQPRRTVALKVIRPGHATAETLRRFQHESEALGRLQHPGIAQIYEASTADTGFGPQPFFAMEFIRGRPLKEFVDARQPNARERLALLAKICDAVDHAHHRGVIHRDLKPANILIDEIGQPKVLDFGVARVTESDAQLTRQTDVGQIVGTLAYMSPEQVAGDPHALDIRSDVYSLGIILYELLAGRLPYDVIHKPLHEAVGIIREDDPAPLSSIHRSYRGDIETIAAKALEKDKTRRYASAADLAADIRRYLADEPILARPASAGYQLQKLARRHRGLVVGTAAVVLVLAAGVVASMIGLVRARTEKRRADTEAATAQAVNDFLQNDLLAQANAAIQSGPGTTANPNLTVRTALDRAAARIAGKFGRQPAVEAAIRSTIGNTYRSLGLYPQAQKQLEQALDLDRRILGTNDPETLKTMRRLALVLFGQGKFPQAAALDSQAMDAQRRVLGPEHPDTLLTTYDLGADRFQEGKPAEAEALIRQTLEIQRRVLGAEHPDTLQSMSGLAAAYSREGKFSQADPLESQTLEIERRVLGPEHPDTLNSMNSLASNYSQEGKYLQAEILTSQTLEIQRRVLGPEHPSTLISMDNLASDYIQEGKYAQAEALFSRICEIQRRLLGPEHPATLGSMCQMAFACGAQGKFAQAEALARRTLEISRRVSGPEHPQTLYFTDILADLYRGENKYADSEALSLPALQIDRRVLGPDHEFTLYDLSILASTYQRQGKYTMARTYAAQALAGWRRAVGSDVPDTMASAEDLALAYQSQGKFAESQPLAREALDVYRQKLPDDWQRFRAESLLGASLAGQKKYAEAEPLLLEGYQGMQARRERIAVFDRHHLDLARGWIVQLYKAWGKTDRAAEWQRK